MRVTKHAGRRMGARSISWQVIDIVLGHGREIHDRGAHIFFVGRREVRAAKERGVDLRAAEGIHVVLTADESTMVTTFRNKRLRRPRRTYRRPHGAGLGRAA